MPYTRDTYVPKYIRRRSMNYRKARFNPYMKDRYRWARTGMRGAYRYRFVKAKPIHPRYHYRYYG